MEPADPDDVAADADGPVVGTVSQLGDTVRTVDAVAGVVLEHLAAAAVALKHRGRSLGPPLVAVVVVVAVSIADSRNLFGPSLRWSGLTR